MSVKLEDVVLMSLTVGDYLEYLNCFDSEPGINRYVESGVVYIETTSTI